MEEEVGVIGDSGAVPGFGEGHGGRLVGDPWKGVDYGGVRVMDFG